MNLFDQETVDLSKEVFSKTGLRDTDDYICHGMKRPADTVDTREVHEHYPLYSSDYILSKLPRYIEVDDERAPEAHLEMHMRGDEFSFSYESYYWEHWDSYHKSVANTSLKALLKLVLSLHESGVKL